MKTRLKPAAAATAVPTAAHAPPTAPAATTASTRRRAGDVPLTSSRKGVRAPSTASAPPSPTAVPGHGACPPAGSRGMGKRAIAGRSLRVPARSTSARCGPAPHPADSAVDGQAEEASMDAHEAGGLWLLREMWDFPSGVPED